MTEPARMLSSEARWEDERRAVSPARDVVFTFSFVSWSAARRRGMNFAQDRLAEALLVHPRVRGLVIADYWRSWPAYVGRQVIGPRDAAFPRERAAHHRALRLRRRDPTSLRAVERTYRRFGDGLGRTAAARGLDRPAVITLNPLVAGFAPMPWAASVTYYATDDWTAHPSYRPWWELYEEAYGRMRATQRRICAVSPAILERIAPTAPSVVVPNGIEPAEWVDPGPPPAWCAALPRPLLLYLGTLDSRVDVAAIAAMSDACPGGSVVLAGQMADPAHFALLRARENVVIHPPLPRRELPGLVWSADVCLVPHHRTRLTEAMSPLKLYEYLAAGRPVVATDLQPMRGLGDRVVLVPPAGDYGGAVRDALARGPAAEPERLAFLADNAWAERHASVLALALA